VGRGCGTMHAMRGGGVRGPRGVPDGPQLGGREEAAQGRRRVLGCMVARVGLFSRASREGGGGVLGHAGERVGLVSLFHILFPFIFFPIKFTH
jgi:hypothetical protein